MNDWLSSTRLCGWLIWKDLTREWRAPRAVSTMVLLGIVLALVITVQVDLGREDRLAVMGGLYWVAAYFAGSVALDRACAGERDDGCWRVLRAYPVAPATVFLAKTVGSFLALTALSLLLLPLFAMLADLAVWDRFGWLFLVILVANWGCATVGTLTSAVAGGTSHRGGALVLLMLPLVSPVLLGASQATRILMQGNPTEEWYRWMQLLAGFGLLFTTIGALVFEFILED